MSAATALLDAIHAYEKEYGTDPRFRRVLVSLDDAQRDIEKLEAQGAYESPGGRQARETAERTDRQEEPKAQQEEPKEPSEQPRDFQQAREAAMARFDAH